jgi:SpoIID/LytB domain protein
MITYPETGTATPARPRGFGCVVRKLCLIAAAALGVCVPAAHAATKMTITGRGFGHGIGMSQYGAYGYSLHLKGYSEILAHYYAGTTLGRLDSNPEVRVLLQGGKRSIGFSGALNAGGRSISASKSYSVRLSRGLLVLRNSAGRKLGTTPGPLRVDAPVGQPLKLFGTSTPGVTNGLYRGSLLISASGSGLIAVNALDLEDYVRGVVSNESPSGWPAEALKAQAVAARTYAITTNAGGAEFDQYADTRSQMYRGAESETPSTDAAVAATAGQVVTYQGRPVTTYFFSTSGGETEDIQNSFLGATPEPWLQGVNDPFDNVSPKHKWGPFRYTRRQVEAKLRGLVRGHFKRIKVLQRGVSPRVVRAQVVGTRGKIAVTGPQLRSRFGLFDTWAFFTTVTSKPKTPKPGTVPPPASPSGGVTPPVRAAMANAPRLVGSISPARAGRWFRVERRVGARWTLAADAVLGRGGSYSVAVPGAGTYRVVLGNVVGPAVRIG